MNKMIKKTNEVVQGKDADFNRRVIENRNTKVLILDHKNKRDRLYERDSGLNHVICKIAKKNNIEFQIDANEFINFDLNSREKAEILSRIVQNIKLFKKFKNKVKVINIKNANKKDIQALFRVLGMSTDLAKKSVN